MDTDKGPVADVVAKQKLRCVGSARPILNPDCRFQRHEILCGRCKRARVECYSVTPATRRPAASDRHPFRAPLSPRSTTTGSETLQNGGSPHDHQRHHSRRSNNDEESNRQTDDVDSLATLPATPSEWMIYSSAEDMSWNNLDPEPPIWTIDPDLNLSRESILDSLDNHRMTDPATPDMDKWSLG